MRALVVHPGTQHSFQLAVELHRLNALLGLHTGFAVAADGMLARACDSLPQYLQRRVANRRIARLPARLVHLQPWLEFAALAGLRWAGGDQGLLYWRNERFQRSIADRALKEADVVIGFDTSSWILARRCRELEKPLVLIQTIGHPDSRERVRDEFTRRFPQWADTQAARLPRVRHAEQEEHEGATLIVASSSFTRQTLIENGVVAAKIRLVPHGIDGELFAPGPTSEKRPFRFVYAGLIDARKGVPLLLEAWRQLKRPDAELWLIGPASRQARALLPELPGLRYLGSVPQRELPGLLRQCDVFVFPSYFEGFGMVILQAMACGLPVVTTDATAGPDLIGGGEGGWVVPRGDLEQFVATMRRCLEHPEDAREAGKRARGIAERYSWQAYGERWLPVLEEAAAGGVPTARASSTTVRRVLLAHPGTQYSGRLARQLQQRGALGEFHTCFAFSGEGLLGRALQTLPEQWQRRLANRRLAGVAPDRLHTRPWLELAAFAELRRGGDEQAVLYRRNAAFQRTIPDRAIEAADVVIGFDTSSWILARRAQALGRVFLLDQSIGHPRSFARAAARLAAEYPQWAETIPTKSEEEIAREEQEHADAARVVVPSRFVARTLEEHGVDPAKIRTNPFGIELERFLPSAAPPALRPLRFVFAGSTRPRKGLPLLLDAWRRLPHGHGAELWVVGEGTIPPAARASLPGEIRFLGRLPQAELAEVFRRSHVFVFPSYFEGLAQVQIEAAACGLPVIGTDSSGCEEIVRHGETGFVLPTGDVDALHAALLGFTSSPERVLPMRARLLEERARWSWDAYGERWITILDEALAVTR